LVFCQRGFGIIPNMAPPSSPINPEFNILRLYLPIFIVYLIVFTANLRRIKKGKREK
jgi:hypothetical protein